MEMRARRGGKQSEARVSKNDIEPRSDVHEEDTSPLQIPSSSIHSILREIA